MIISIYDLELDNDKRSVLVEKDSFTYVTDILNSPKAIVEMLNTVFGLKRKAEEQLYMIAFNTKCKVLGIFLVSHGTVSLSLCNPREIFIRALLCGAVQIALVHNHPSGDPQPSKEDFKVFSKVKKSGELLGVPLLDNVIVGDSYFSFKENNLYSEQ